MTPEIGDTVHYVSHGVPFRYPMACRAAVVTEVPLQFEPGSAEEHRSRQLSLAVLNPTGMFFNREVPECQGSAQPPVPGTAYDDIPRALCGGLWYVGGTWHWPHVHQDDTAG